MRDAGLRLGEFLSPGVRVSTRHYTLVADDTPGPAATAEAFVAAVGQVQDRVRQATGVWLAPEPDALGDLPAYQHLLDRAQAAGGAL
jgi:UDP-N-acetylmuramate dehydrogenase